MTAWVDPSAWERAEAEGRNVEWSIYQDPDHPELGTIATVMVAGEVVFTGAAPIEFRRPDTPTD